MQFKQNQQLYKVSVSTGKIQVWFGWTEGAEVKCAYGELIGKIQVNTYTAEPKNQGRANATTAEQQAIVELEAMYRSQLDNKHYKLTEVEAQEAAKVCREPRKITNYKDRYSKMSNTLLSSIKKNGSRGCVLEGQLYSKVGRPEDIKVDHLRVVVEELGELATFDCEVYAEGLSLQRIRSAWLKPYKTDKEIIKVAKDRIKKLNDVDPKTIKTAEQAISYLGYNPNDDAPKLKFWIFDIPTDSEATYEKRIEWMSHFEHLVAQKKLEVYFEFLYPVETHSHEERTQLRDKVCAEGSEGLVHYEPKGVYEFGKRSTNTAKDKSRYDGEALVIGIEMCKNGEGKLKLRCSDALDRVEFSAMMKGNHASRMYDVQKQFIGQWVTFDYEELSEAGKPTKGVVRETRLCDEDGSPLN